jgi:hypothetical protein
VIADDGRLSKGWLILLISNLLPREILSRDEEARRRRCGEHRRGGLTKPACREAALAAAPPRIAAATGGCPAEKIASEASAESFVNNAR